MSWMLAAKHLLACLLAAESITKVCTVTTVLHITYRGNSEQFIRHCSVVMIIDVARIVPSSSTFPSHPLFPIFPWIVTYSHEAFQVIWQSVVKIPKQCSLPLEQILQKVQQGVSCLVVALKILWFFKLERDCTHKLFLQDCVKGEKPCSWTVATKGKKLMLLEAACQGSQLQEGWINETPSEEEGNLRKRSTNLIRYLDLLELHGAMITTTDVGMKLESKAAICFLNFMPRGSTTNSESCVIISDCNTISGVHGRRGNQTALAYSTTVPPLSATRTSLKTWDQRITMEQHRVPPCKWSLV